MEEVQLVRESYDRVASGYAAQFLAELDHKPLDRALLRCFAEMVGPDAQVGDVGCGPGHVTRHLAGLGLSPFGVDLAPAMAAQARDHSPDLPFLAGSMLSLPVPDGAWNGLVALYSIIHLQREQLPTAFAEFRRVLRPGGVLLVSFHLGDEVRHLDEWLGQPVTLDFHFFERPAVEAALTAAGFRISTRVEREPYEGHEVPTRRAYLLARR